ncbi:MAG: hypothetical protein R6U17_08655 [Thermoplasmata archaeon]
MRPLIVHPETGLHVLRERGKFRSTSPHERLEEIKLMVKELDVSAVICFDHFLNGWRNKDGGLLFDASFKGYQLPKEQDRVLELAEEGLRVDESLHFDPRRSVRTSL